MLVELALFVVVLLLLRNAFSGSKDAPPGPWGLPLVGYMPFMTRKPHVKFAEMAKTYGDVFMVTIGSYRAVVLNSASAIREALKDGVFAGRPELYLFNIRSWGRNRGVLLGNGSEWHEQRRFILRNLRDLGFGRKSMEVLIADEAVELCQRLKKHVGQPLELRNRFNVAVFNSLWALIAGEKFQQDDPRCNLFVQRVTTNMSTTNMSGIALFMPWLAKCFPHTFRLPFMYVHVEELHQFIKEVIDEHRATYSPDSPRDLIDVYLKEMEECTDTDSSFYGEESEKTLITCLQDLFVAGTETTSTTITWAMLHLVRNPHIQKKVQEEVDRVVGKSRIPSLNDRPNMPYTEAVIMESERLNAILPLTVFHATTEDVEFRGYKIPKDTVVFPNTYATGHDPKNWVNPDEFIPERFLCEDGKTLQRPDGFMPFSAGKRQCLGESLAKDSLFLFVTNMMQQFNVEPVPGKGMPSLDEDIGLVVMPKVFKIILKDRSVA